MAVVPVRKTRKAYGYEQEGEHEGQTADNRYVLDIDGELLLYVLYNDGHAYYCRICGKSRRQRLDHGHYRWTDDHYFAVLQTHRRVLYG